MADLSKGFIVLSRCFDDYKYWQSPIAISLWVKILLKANWKDGWFMGTEIPRGSFATSIKNLSEEIGVSHNTITKWLKIFEKEKQISLKSTNKFTVISVVNYALFQDFEIDTGKQSGKQTGKQSGKQSGDNRTKQQGNKGKKNDDDIYTRARKLLDLERKRNVDAYQGNPNVDKAFDKLERIIKEVPMTENVLNNMYKAITIACHHWIDGEHDGIVYPVAYIKSVLTGENDDI